MINAEKQWIVFAVINDKKDHLSSQNWTQTSTDTHAKKHTHTQSVGKYISLFHIPNLD